MGLPADEARRLADKQRIAKATAEQERAKAKEAAETPAETPAEKAARLLRELEAEEEHFAGEAERRWGGACDD